LADALRCGIFQYLIPPLDPVHRPDLSQHAVALLLGFLISALVIPVVVRLAHARGVLDHPDDGRRNHVQAVPRLGGIAVFIGTLLTSGTILLWGTLAGVLALPYPAYLPAISLGALVVFLTGLTDDLRGLSPLLKLGAQTLAAALVIQAGLRVETIAIAPGIPTLSLGWLATPITLLWVVGITNAFNLIDGIDQLASTMAILTLAVCMAVDLALNGVSSVIITTAMVGALLAFLRWNRHPARIFLGDSGSMTLGFFLSVRVLIAATDSEGVTYALIPLTALAFPLLDTFVAMARRWLRGHPLSRADGRHIHHRLLALGFSVPGTVRILWLASAGVALIGIAVSFSTVVSGGALFLVFVALLLLGVAYGSWWLGYDEFIELGRSAVSVVRQARTVLRQKVRANELATRVGEADSLEALHALFAAFNAESKGVRVELVGAGAPGVTDGRVSFEYPVRGGEGVNRLRLTARRPNGVRVPAQLERIAERVGPAVEGWLERRHQPGGAVVSPSGVSPHSS
jgi:UDP-GlcNAc:undecaprenyl-phosphate GlcNAc-1-phosphate transferase